MAYLIIIEILKYIIKIVLINQSGSPAGKINLALATVKQNPNINRNFVFEVVSPYHTFILQAEDEDIMNRQISKINNEKMDCNYRKFYCSRIEW